MRFAIDPVPVLDPAAEEVLDGYFTDLVARWWNRPARAEEVVAARADDPSTDLTPPTGRFLLARVDGVPAGCVGLRWTADVPPGVAELTRLYVRPSHRRLGLGRALLTAAERAAVEHGRRTLRLDTRTDLLEARALYAAAGYTETAPFNTSPYAHHWLTKCL